MDKFEKLYRTQDGKLVFNAIQSVGVDRAYPCQHLHGYRDNGFPANAPIQHQNEDIWLAFSGMPGANTVTN